MFGLVDTEDTSELLAFCGISIIIILFGYFLAYAYQHLEKVEDERKKNDFNTVKFNEKYKQSILDNRQKRIDSDYIHDF